MDGWRGRWGTTVDCRLFVEYTIREGNIRAQCAPTAENDLPKGLVLAMGGGGGRTQYTPASLSYMYQVPGMSCVPDAHQTSTFAYELRPKANHSEADLPLATEVCGLHG